VTEERRKENKFILYTDIVGHTKMFGRLGAVFRPMRERHDEMFQQAIRTHAPSAIVQGSGDGFFAATDDVGAAIEAALAFRRALVTEDWGRFLPPEKRTPDNMIRARVGLHVGLVNVFYRDGVGKDFDGPPRTVAEKVMSMAVGNQVLLTRAVRDQGLLNLTRRDELDFKRFGEFLMRGLADTVEVWAIGEPDMPVGPRPVQPPEHRVIVFSTIHEFSSMNEKMGPDFDPMKDVWDACFAEAVLANSKDAFLKRLPDGSLAAFKNAMDATRAARDFRRGFKLKTKNAMVRFEPKIALDSGLVTFDYENNRSVDVRDQPVNIAAKVCKSGLAAPWQLILSRPVREDAYQNLPERDEFKWVCLGRKPVPGEPEPLELWDFQDVQQKSEHRTLVYIDFKKVAEALRNLPAISSQFNERLNELVGEVIGRRTEEPWLLPVDGPAGGAMGLAFKDPVEAIQGAIDLRDTATKEQWERILTGFKRASRDDNLLKIAVTAGQVRLTYEDGLIREFKGAALETARPLVGVAENSQIIVQRELKEAVAAAFPESDVKWKKVEAAALGDEPAIDAFELRRGSVRNNKPILIGVGIFALAAAITLGIAMPKIMGTRQDQGPWAVGSPPPEISNQVRSLEAILPPESVAVIRDALNRYAERDYKNVKEITTVREGFTDVDAALKAITARNATTGFNADAAKEFASTPPGESKEQVVAWLGNFIKQTAIPDASNPITTALTKDRDLKNLEERIKASKSVDQATLLQEFKDVSAKVDSARKMRWTEPTKDQVIKSVDEAKAAFVALGKKVPETEEATKQDDPEWLKTAVGAMNQSDESVIKSIGRLVGSALRNNIETPGAKAKADALAGPLAALAGAKANYDLDALDEFVVTPLRGKGQGVTLDDLSGIPAVIASTERLAGQSLIPEISAAERRTVALRLQYEQTGHADEPTIKTFDTLRARLGNATQLRWIKRDEAELKAAKAEAEKQLADGSDLQKKVVAAIALADSTVNASANLNRLLGERDIAPGFASINEQWQKTAQALAARQGQPAAARLEEALKLKTDLTGVAEKFKEQPDFGGSLWQRSLAGSVRRQRDEELKPALEKVGTPAFRAAVDAADTAYKASLGEAKAFAGSVSALIFAIDHAYVLGDTLPNSSKKVADLAREIATSPYVKNDAAMASAVTEYTQRVSALARIDASTNPAELLQIVNTSVASRPEVPVAVWRRLGDAALLDQAGYLDALFQAQDEIGRLPGLTDAARKKELKDEVSKTIASRWSMHFARLSDEAPIRRAMVRRERVGTDADLLASMQPQAKYNFKRALLSTALESGDEKKIQEAVAAFMSDPFWQALPPNSPARTTLSDLGAIGAGGGGGAVGGEMPLGEIGPGSAGWKLVEANADSATYEFAPGGPRLTFIRVQAGNTASWVCSTELSLGVASEVVMKNKLAGTFKQMFSDKGDHRGPFVWSRDALGNPRLGNPTGERIWTPSSPALANRSYYPRDPGPPTVDHPMNYLTPSAAMFLARAIGCRPITSAEWKAAAAMEPDAKNPAKWNLRDATFKELLDYRNSDPNNKRSGTFDPDTQNFPTQPQDKSTLASDDKYLWFAKVNDDVSGPKKFHHLVGNVAEMVYEDAEKAEQIKRNDVNDLVNAAEANSKFKVIGASAMSGLTAGDAKPDVVLPMRNVELAAAPVSIRGFADVGVRLAFSARKNQEQAAPFLTKVAPIIRRAPYLSPSN